MVMLGPHYLENPSEYDQIIFPLQYSHLDSMSLIENLSFKGFLGFWKDNFEFHDPIYDWLEASYLASPFSNSKFWYFLMFSK